MALRTTTARMFQQVLNRPLGAAGPRRLVNTLHQPSPYVIPSLAASDNSTNPKNVSTAHWDDAWDTAKIRDSLSNNCTMTWGPSSPLKTVPIITHGDGVYVYDTEGKQYIDWTSGAICSNLGHSVPDSIINGMTKQLKTVPFTYSGHGLTEIRARLGNLMSELCPGDINSFLFPSGGAEANEAAMRIARRYTGRHKFINYYRSYHGGTSQTVTATGDFRRNFDDTATGFVKAFNPTPQFFKWGATEAEVTNMSLAALEEQVISEGPETIAGIMFESIIGSGGVIKAPEGYMQGVRAICDKYDILLILDEVMVGFGRTGKFWGFQHYEGVVPDIMTSAKGLSAAWQPVSVVGMRQKIRDHFESTPLGWGATFQAHPVALSCAYEVLKYMISEDVLGNVQKLAPIMEEELSKIEEKHSCVRQTRSFGLFGCIDLVGEDGHYIQQLQQPNPPQVAAFKKALLDNGIYGLVRPPFVHCAPPLVINEDQLRDGFSRISKALEHMDH